MTLAAPPSRASLVRPLTESVDLYDNPDTPGTTYSFQDQAPLKPTMQAEIAHHLTAPILDASMLMSTDDEMLDSDSDQRRDEDFDIDLDAEVYSVSGGDLEVNMTMEDDSVEYGHVDPEVDNDDIMLDDEPVEYIHEISDASHSTKEATAEDAAQPENSDSTQPHISSEATSALEQSHVSQETGDDRPGTGLDVSGDSPELEVTKFNSMEVPTASELQPKHTVDGIHEAVSVEQPQPSPPSHVEPAIQPNSTTEQEENDGSQSSTATLTHEVPGNDERFPANDHEHAMGYELQTKNEYPRPVDFDSSRGEDSYDSSYQYPIIVQYEQIQLTLFPSMADWSEDPALAEIYSDIPSDYLLPDVRVCDKPLGELFMHLRDVLGPAVGLESELVMDIELLGLKIGEDNTACKSVSLRRILDLHNQLYENDGYDIALPANMALYTVPRFYCRLEEISAAVQERKGLQECLSLLKLPLVDEYSNDEDIAGHTADVADTNESQRVEHPQTIPVESEQASADEHGSPEHNPSENARFDVQSGDNILNQEANNIDNVDDQPTVREDSGEPDDIAFVASDSLTIKPSENPESDHVVPAPSTSREEEEELLEYDEDDENDSAQAPTEQPRPASPTDHTNEDEPLTGRNSAANAEGEGERFSDNPVSPSQHSGEEHDTDERFHPTGPTANGSDWNGSPSNPDDDSSNKPSPIPVFGGDDNEGEYDNQQHSPETYGYEQGEQRDLYQERSEQSTENGYDNIERNFNDEQDDGSGDAESYEEESFQDQDGYDESGNYYEEIPGDYIEHEETEFIQGDCAQYA
ncbi:hypothetical protein K440DRAFT_137391 [Wilcoxina mikolae CBS 423.85]|nr:hypothetical protein K440DRAFT_137391 [Wilcoxina mikolae CBS 423.85]